VAINQWFKEIIEESEFLAKRKNEVDKELAEFLNRAKELDLHFVT
jgi:hypothetical protein